MEVDKNNIQVMEGNEDRHCGHLMPSDMHLPHWTAMEQGRGADGDAAGEGGGVESEG